MRIFISQFINNKDAVLNDDAQRLFNKIYNHLNEDVIVLDFDGVTLLTPSFLNVAIGQLYKTFDSEFLNSRLRVENISDADMYVLKKVILTKPN